MTVVKTDFECIVKAADFEVWATKDGILFVKNFKDNTETYYYESLKNSLVACSEVGLQEISEIDKLDSWLNGSLNDIELPFMNDKERTTLLYKVSDMYATRYNIRLEG